MVTYTVTGIHQQTLEYNRLPVHVLTTSCLCAFCPIQCKVRRAETEIIMNDIAVVTKSRYGKSKAVVTTITDRTVLDDTAAKCQALKLSHHPVMLLEFTSCTRGHPAAATSRPHVFCICSQDRLLFARLATYPILLRLVLFVISINQGSSHKMVTNSNLFTAFKRILYLFY